MKKKMILFVMFLALVLSACQTEKFYASDEQKIIKGIESGGVYVVFVDTETGVMYLHTTGGVCTMVNQDGSPKIWNN